MELSRRSWFLSSNAGFGVVEVMVSILLVSAIAFGLMRSMVMSSEVSLKNQYRSLAFQIASESLEEFVSVDLTTITGVVTQSNVISKEGKSFVRDTSVVPNADGTVTATVTVSCAVERFDTSVTLSRVYSSWSA